MARQYMSEHELFVRTAKQWTQQYANECVLARDAVPLPPPLLLVSPPRHPSFRASSGESEKFQRLAEMGFDAAAIRRALSETSGDEPAALEKLLSSLS